MRVVSGQALLLPEHDQASHAEPPAVDSFYLKFRPQQRRLRLWRLPLGSITADGPFRQSKSRACTSQLFHKIGHGKQELAERDVHAFAVKAGLPVAYVKPFFTSLQRAKLAFPDGPFSKGVDYETFHRFVTARESALRRVFDTLDTNKDGHISEQDMRIGLSHMVVRCPNSRCCYRTRADRLAAGAKSVAGSAATAPRVTFCDFRHRFLLLPSDSVWEEYWLAAGHPSCCDVGQPVPYADPQRKRGASPWGHLLAGAMAGATSRTATAPLETLRIMAMTGALQPAAGAAGGGGLAAAAGALVRTQGWGALYRGNFANVVRSAPQKGIDFLAFDLFKSALAARPASSAAGVQTASISSSAGRGARQRGGGGVTTSAAVQPGTAATLAAAGLAGAVSNTVLYPLEVVRTRLSTDASGTYRGVCHAFNAIRRIEGVPALYRGLVPSVAAILPEAAITYGLFDILKRSFTRWSGREEAGVLPSLSAGVLAAFMGQVVAYPLETVSRRMQIAKGGGPGNMFAAAGALVREGGPQALFRGLGAASVRVVPMAVVSFGTYEFVRLQYVRLETELELRAARNAQRELPSCELQCTV